MAALRPLVAGATTTTEVLDRALTGADLKRLDALARELSQRGSRDIQQSVKPLLALSSNAEGETAEGILRIRL